MPLVHVHIPWEFQELHVKSDSAVNAVLDALSTIPILHYADLEAKSLGWKRYKETGVERKAPR